MSRASWGLLGGGLIVALVVVVLLAPNASDAPDGLERVAHDEGFADEADESPFELLPDYSIPGVENEMASRVFAGAIGAIAVAAIAIGGAWALRHRGQADAPTGDETADSAPRRRATLKP